MQSSNDLLSRIERLESLEALRALKAQYTVHADRCLITPSVENARALAELFTDDATTDYDFFGKFSGKEGIVHAFVEVLPARARWAAHHAVNPILSVDGDTAEGTWSFVAHNVPREPKDAARVAYFGSYEEKYRRVGGAWKFSSLIVRFSSP